MLAATASPTDIAACVGSGCVVALLCSACLFSRRASASGCGGGWPAVAEELWIMVGRNVEAVVAGGSRGAAGAIPAAAARVTVQILFYVVIPTADKDGKTHRRWAHAFSFNFLPATRLHPESSGLRKWLPSACCSRRRASASALFRDIRASCSGVNERAAMPADGGEEYERLDPWSICDDGGE
jgi:hypothetical protein